MIKYDWNCIGFGDNLIENVGKWFKIGYFV
jgi:hypothetical protein